MRPGLEPGSFTSPTTAAGTITFTGGTGRLRNASGTAHFEAVIAPDGAHVSITFEGTIRFWEGMGVGTKPFRRSWHRFSTRCFALAAWAFNAVL